MNTNTTPNCSRRRFLKQTFAFSAAVLLARPHRLRAAESVPAGAHELLMIGDWGLGAEEPEKAQVAVARGMADYVREQKFKPEALMLLGDNFYGKMPGGVTSPRWQNQFEAMYPRSVFDCPCPAILGNHDYNIEPKGKWQAQLDYAASNPGTRWTMPAKWYRWEFPKVKPLITFLMLDSNFFPADLKKDSLTQPERDAQMQWLKAELAKPRTAPFLVMCGHHPLFNNGKHGDGKEQIAAWDKLMRAHRVDFYFCGHDHDLQHLEFAGHPTSFVISGGGGARLYDMKEIAEQRGPFSQSVYGFTHLSAAQDRLIVRHLDANRKLLHAFSKTPKGVVTMM